MLFIIGMVVTLTVVLVIIAVRVARRIAPAPLGWMSEQWLAEHRASHPS